MKRFTLFSLVLAGLLLTTSATHAAPMRKLVKYSTGTGFVVSRAGHIITNNHVLRGCQSIRLQGAGLKGKPAKLVARDRNYDLALIKTSLSSPRTATLRREYTPPRPGERVMLLGYPGDASQNGKYVINFSKVKDLSGPMGEAHYLQFENSANHGNSGGPLLDFAGNVVGVITAKVDIHRHNPLAARNELVSSSDVAITLPILQKFLDRHAVRYQTSDSLIQLSKRRMEATARNYTVNILCKQSEEMVP